MDLISWFESEKRDFPWREHPTPYRVWISEIMLQQTQASVVLPYFERWMERFPSIELLAKASLEELIKLWEGLGYYSRVRNIYEAAQFICKQYGGVFPQAVDELSKIKGIGPYTIGAIRSFAFHERAPAIDGNVIRVMTRYQLIDGEVSKKIVQNAIHNAVEAFLPEYRPWIAMEALIELGARVCKKHNPQCLQCTLRSSCKAFRSGRVAEFPNKKKSLGVTKLYRLVPVIVCKDHVLLQKGKKGQVMSDLYEFPYITQDVDVMDIQEGTEIVKRAWGVKTCFDRELPRCSHGFTRYKAFLSPFLCTVKEQVYMDSCFWHPIADLDALPFSAGHKRILTSFYSVRQA